MRRSFLAMGATIVVFTVFAFAAAGDEGAHEDVPAPAEAPPPEIAPAAADASPNMLHLTAAMGGLIALLVMAPFGWRP